MTHEIYATIMACPNHKAVNRILPLLPREEFPVMPGGFLGNHADDVDMRTHMSFAVGVLFAHIAQALCDE